jgi:hypothetical protein
MPVDATNAISLALGITKKLREVSDRVKDADVKLLIADLSIQLADAKQQQADLMNEVTELRAQLQALAAGAFDPCPSCRKPTWSVASSKPSKHMGGLGVVDRTYKCSSCDFTETHTEVPGDVSGKGPRRR